jgi:hypothetical protein
MILSDNHTAMVITLSQVVQLIFSAGGDLFTFLLDVLTQLLACSLS